MITFHSSYVTEEMTPGRVVTLIYGATMPIETVYEESAQVTPEMWQYLLERIRRMDTPLIIYHGGCKDGFCAAWVAKTYFDAVGKETEFFAASYGKEPPPVEGRNVFILDFSYPRDVLLKMWKEAHVIRVLDHHKTAQEDLKELDFCTFDMNRSGAGMAWDYFFHGKPRPYIVNYVEDRDLWRWALPDSREVNSYLQTLPYDFAVWTQVSQEDWSKVRDLGIEFMRVRKDNNKANMDILMQFTQFDGEEIPVINAPTEGISELMETMLLQTRASFALAWRLRNDGRVSISLRSTAGEGSWDVSRTAQKYGGGGHRNAAGFELCGHLAMSFLARLVQMEESSEASNR